MTTVLGYAVGQDAWLAADTMTNVYDRPVESAVKIRRMSTTEGGEFLLGFAGDGGGPAVVTQHLTVKATPALDDQADCDAWASAIASAITDLYLERSMADAGRMDSNHLVALPGHLWTITHHQAIRHPDGKGAIGSGEGPALGALHAYLDSAPSRALAAVDPAAVMVAACLVGINLDRYSGGQVQLEHLAA